MFQYRITTMHLYYNGTVERDCTTYTKHKQALVCILVLKLFKYSNRSQTLHNYVWRDYSCREAIDLPTLLLIARALCAVLTLVSRKTAQIYVLLPTSHVSDRSDKRQVPSDVFGRWNQQEKVTTNKAIGFADRILKLLFVKGNSVIFVVFLGFSRMFWHIIILRHEIIVFPLP